MIKSEYKQRLRSVDYRQLKGRRLRLPAFFDACPQRFPDFHSPKLTTGLAECLHNIL